MNNVLFVCLGNICRSPMAEAMFRQMVKQANLESQFQIDSAGTSSEETGNPPHPGTREILAKYNIPADGLVARQITRQDFENADYIICMDGMNYNNLVQMAGPSSQDKVHRIFELVPGEESREIPDPWYTHRFQDTYDSLAAALPSWFDYLTK
ncbi:low molecular weight protein-tyrosine-phosphatase [Paucilactobacillus nenjiangensis]|jgi:protein-tyrosine phosphatase|uniref:protein-tyrosine-phosphatase n=1 Tax=Paucilactobacillus nenjiangensis TaxID=1296540 RepID=A0A5P1X6J8_9LACO|nr:low molecular weight protein-tyrosine-phosphatase [Paucilactobacillus nenjiangensis]QER68091.1 low molecular weight phosphotyrosine protein phosphatase [Paucilactobacillus nenjiangensis]